VRPICSEDDHLYLGVARGNLKCVVDLVQHLPILRIARLGSRQYDARDAWIGKLVANALVGSGLLIGHVDLRCFCYVLACQCLRSRPEGGERISGFGGPLLHPPVIRPVENDRLGA
jgi:hypothetical protein